MLHLQQLLIMAGDVEQNPGPQTVLISHANIRSMCPTDRTLKLDEIETIMCNQKNCDIICLSETWLDETISDNQVEIQGFQIHRKDRTRINNRRPAGGVAIFARDNLPVKRRKDLELDSLELLFIELTTCKKRILIGCGYRAPGATADEVKSFIENYQLVLNNIYQDRPESFVILGDFNDKCISWEALHTGSELGQKFFDLVTGNNLFQLIKESTHITETSSSLLDLIITDSPGYIMDAGTWAPLGDPYHCSIYCKFQIQYPKDKKYTRHIWYYDQCNYDNLNEAILNAPWGVIDIFDDVDEAVDYFTDLLLNISKEHIPNREITIRPKDKPWMTSHVKQAIKLRDRAHKKWVKNKTVTNEMIYKNARHEVNVRKFHAKLLHEEKIANKLQNPSTNAKEYWHLTKVLYGTKVKSGIPSIIDGDRVYSDAKSKANVFNLHFSEKSKLPEILPDIPEFRYLTDERLDSVHVDTKETEKILKNLDISKANGPDNISNRLLKSIATAISPVLTKICNMSLLSGTFPSKLKEAHVTPVLKKMIGKTKATLDQSHFCQPYLKSLSVMCSWHSTNTAQHLTYSHGGTLGTNT